MHKIKKKGCSSNYIGVSKRSEESKTPWLARIRADGKIYNHSLTTELEAARWYDNAAFYFAKGTNFIPKTNNLLTETEIANPLPPDLFKKVSGLPKHISRNGNGFRVKLIDADGKQIIFYRKSLEEAIKTENIEFHNIQAEKERRHLAREIEYDQEGRAVITLNKTKKMEQPRKAQVDKNIWHQVERYSWNWNGDERCYPIGWVNGKPIYMHTFVWQLHNPGAERGDKEIDHIDHNKLNCLSTNIRLVTRSENVRNKRKRAGTTSTKMGVCKLPNGKYQAAIRLNGKSNHLGTYDDEEEAAQAYKKACPAIV